MKKQLFKSPIVWVAALLILGGGGYGAVASGIVDLNQLKNLIPSVPSQSEVFAAQVNGEGVPAAALQIRFNQAKKSTEAQGTMLEAKDSELLKQQVLDDMISEMLLIQHGKKQGMTAQAETIESEFQKIIAQFPSEEEFEKNLSAQGARPDDVRDVISRQLIIQQIADQQAADHPIEISEEDMQKEYDAAVAAGQEVPPFEEVKTQIEGYLRNQKIGELMNALIIQLREQANIQIL
jgi:hypothetical protein